MCTATTYQTKDHYFGRTFDNEFAYCETVTVTPRNFPFAYRMAGEQNHHYAMIGIAYVQDGYPLYYDATNEKGLSMAGLNFPGNADYKEPAEGVDNVTPFEFIPWILGQCADVAEARVLLGRINLVKINFSDQLPLSPLHWILADAQTAITVECVREGLKIYENPAGVLTNNPPFEMQMFHLNNYRHLTAKEPENTFSQQLDLQTYCKGLGGMGLPGDLSSMSRFVRAAFVKLNSVSGDSESESISQFFHILGAVDQQRGCALVGEDQYEITIYTSCCNAAKGIYYYTTYENHQISGVDMHRENLDSDRLVSYPLIREQQIRMQN